MAAKRAPNVIGSTELAKELGLPGWWTVARLEERGVLPTARRGLWTRWRWWYRDEVPALRLRLALVAGLPARDEYEVFGG